MTSAEPTSEEPADSGGSKGRKRKQLPVWQETILLLVLALGLAILIKAFFLQAFYIPSPSMRPGLIENDRILVEKISYWGDDDPERGDVVVFEDPGGWLGPEASHGPDDPLTTALAAIGLYPTGGHLVKRVVGVEGDVIECCDEQGRLEVNGVPVDGDAYLAPGAECAGPMTGDCDWKAGPVPEDHIFVMGDNRARSADSTVHMCREDETACVPGREYVSLQNVVGRVFALVWPVDRWRWLDGAEALSTIPRATER